MATWQATIDALLDLCDRAGIVTALRMFGEYCLYLDGTPVALVCRDLLHVKPTDAGRALVPGVEEASPFLGAKPYLLIPADLDAGPERREALCRLLQATRDALPPPKPRRARRSSRHQA